MPLYARRTDANHASIREALRQCGWTVADLSGAGRGFPDLVAIRTGMAVFLEIKDGSKSASRRKLTPKQVELHQAFAAAGFPIVVLTSVEEAVRL